MLYRRVKTPNKKKRKLPNGRIDNRWKTLRCHYFNKNQIKSVLSRKKTVFRTICYKQEVNKKSNKLLIPKDGVPYSDYGVVPKYRVGDIMAIPMCHREIAEYWHERGNKGQYNVALMYKDKPSWDNRKLVEREFYPYRIRITKVRVERFRDITEEEMLKDGVLIDEETKKYYVDGIFELVNGTWRTFKIKLFDTPTDAFKAMWKRICRTNPWDNNPMVCVYDFELLESGKDFKENLLETIRKK